MRLANLLRLGGCQLALTCCSVPRIAPYGCSDRTVAPCWPAVGLEKQLQLQFEANFSRLCMCGLSLCHLLVVLAACAGSISTWRLAC